MRNTPRPAGTVSTLLAKGLYAVRAPTPRGGRPKLFHKPWCATLLMFTGWWLGGLLLTGCWLLLAGLSTPLGLAASCGGSRRWRANGRLLISTATPHCAVGMALLAPLVPLLDRLQRALRRPHADSSGAGSEPLLRSGSGDTASLAEGEAVSQAGEEPRGGEGEGGRHLWPTARELRLLLLTTLFDVGATVTHKTGLMWVQARRRLAVGRTDGSP